MSIVAFLLAVVGIWGGVHVFLGRRLISASPISRGWRRVGWGLLAALAVLVPVTFSLERAGFSSPLLEALLWVAYIYMGFFSLVLVMVLVRDLAFLGRGLLGKFGGRMWPEPSEAVGVARAEPPPVDKSRRAFLTGVSNAGILSTGVVLSGVGFAEARRDPDVVRVEVPVKGLPPALDGFTIAQISDLHVGPTIRRPFVERIVALVNGLEADMVAITGDLIDGLVPDRREDVAPLGELRSRHGTFYVTGNHEYYWGAAAWIDEARRLGMRPLVNAHALVEHEGGRVVVAGVTDHREGRRLPGHESDPAGALKDAPEADVRVLLAHQPRSIFKAAEVGRYDLQLSGHTHGGQFVPWNFVVWMAQPFTAGLHLFEGMWIYVSRGTGYWGPPMRLAAPSEVTLLTLRPA